MRVVAGELRGRRIEGPRGEATRPTTDKVREAVFNALSSMDVLDGARVVDLFAGSGALGIEALSRGAAHCVFVERDRDALANIKKNIEALNLHHRCEVLARDAMGVLDTMVDVDLVLADPPYGFSQWKNLLGKSRVPVVVLESDREIGDVAGYTTVRERRYGRTFVAILRDEGLAEGTVEGT